jgi:hypothetical protein
MTPLLVPRVVLRFNSGFRELPWEVLHSSDTVVTLL